MGINFRKRKKILPGVYLNFSKNGISTTVGPRGANVNFGKNGAYLNIGIPGTGIYSRQKIGSENGGRPPYTPTNNFSSSTNIIKSYNSKTTTILLALFLGTFGAHRFYLGQYWKGIFYILFFWTYIPTIISLIDVVVFAVMSQGIFDDKYNSLTLRSAVQNCSGCGTPSGSKANNFSYQYYSLLKDFSKSLLQIVYKLQSNEAILERINAGQLQTASSEFIASCVIYDIIQVSNVLAKGKLSAKSLEATGMVLATNQLLPENCEDMLDKDFDTLALAHQQGLYQDIARQLLDAGAIENPLQITIQEQQDEKIISSTERQKNLSFPTFLKILNNPLFEEYATILYRYATIISKADNVVSKTEETLLKDIYQMTHNPIPEKKNEALHISKGNKNESLDEVLNELNSLIGLDKVKDEINTLINFIKVQKAREQAGLKSSSLSYHIVFTGNPGTGKTTVARIVAKIYKHLGILTEGQLVETDRSGLVAEYIGQTAVKVNKTVNSALNGILFIDEAYSLIGENKDDFGKEAVATLIKRMEDDRDKLVLVLAGYTKEMSDFIDTNPGFKSRFNRYISFPDYTPDELFEIFESSCKKLDYRLTQDAKAKLKSVFENAYSTRDKSFGNGRFVRNVFEKALEQQANRIAKESNLTKEILTTIKVEDIAEIGVLID